MKDKDGQAELTAHWPDRLLFVLMLLAMLGSLAAWTSHYAQYLS
jgi:hypothetical protein